jgi:hypothetical protein
MNDLVITAFILVAICSYFSGVEDADWWRSKIDKLIDYLSRDETDDDIDHMSCEGNENENEKQE